MSHLRLSESRIPDETNRFSRPRGTPWRRRIVFLSVWVIGWSLTAPATATAQGVCDRTPQVRDRLVEAAGVSSCEDVTPEHLGAVTLLDLSESGIGDPSSPRLQGSRPAPAPAPPRELPHHPATISFPRSGPPGMAGSEFQPIEGITPGTLQGPGLSATSLAVWKPARDFARRHLQRAGRAHLSDPCGKLADQFAGGPLHRVEQAGESVVAAKLAEQPARRSLRRPKQPESVVVAGELSGDSA